MEIAASVLRRPQGRRPCVRCIVIPGSPAIYKESMKRGYIDAFIDAGCAVSTPTCGPCLGGYMGIMWLPASAASRRRTAISVAAWAMSTVKSTSLARKSQPRVQS